MTSASNPKAPNKTILAGAFYVVERALHDSLSLRQFGDDERQQVLTFFAGSTCVYCGAGSVRGFDHLVAVIEGGEAVLGNMVPACGTCDDSKGRRPFEEWMRGTAKCSPATRGVPDVEQRVARIRAYISLFRYVPRSLDSRLDEDERLELESIRVRLADVRRASESLVLKYRRRTDRR